MRTARKVGHSVVGGIPDALRPAGWDDSESDWGGQAGDWLNHLTACVMVPAARDPGYRRKAS
jgi:hypothetical protein